VDSKRYSSRDEIGRPVGPTGPPRKPLSGRRKSAQMGFLRRCGRLHAGSRGL